MVRQFVKEAPIEEDFEEDRDNFALDDLDDEDLD